MTAPRLPRSLRRRAAAERIRRCWCGRSIAADSMSTCGCCCTEHDAPLATPPRLPEHLRTDDINDYLRQKGEL